ncbi:MAG: ATP-binding protein, partial [Bacteroidota bacterium]
LRTVNNFSEILMSDFHTELNPKAQKYLGNVRKGAQNMSSLIEALLRFSRTGTKKLVVSNLDIQGMVQELAHELSSQVENRNIDIQISPLEACKGDIDLIKQVFTNFIWNAIKFSAGKEKTIIKISSEKLEDMISYTVEDNGVGFDMEYADKIFNVFQRLHSASEFEGTGVGLAIVQKIVGRHGGKVIAEGEVDKGAKFTFTLPGLDTDVSIEPTVISVL